MDNLLRKSVKSKEEREFFKDYHESLPVLWMVIVILIFGLIMYILLLNQPSSTEVAEPQEAVPPAEAPTVEEIPLQQEELSIYEEAGRYYGIDSKLLEAIHVIETGQDGLDTGYSYKISYAGAMGAMQFMPGTWSAYGVDGDGDGVADINNLYDAVYSAANYLTASGVHANEEAAIFAYNHSWDYVNKVQSIKQTL